MIWLETVINGALLGGLYGLFGVGLALVFGVTRIVNIMHGEFIALTAFIGLGVTMIAPDIHPLLLLLPVMILSFALGYGLQAVFINRAMRLADPLAALLLTFGLSVIVRNLMAELFGVSPRTIRQGGFAQMSLDVFGFHLGVLPLTTLGISVFLFVMLQFLLRRTEIGRVVRATADNSEVARLMGIKPTFVYNVVMGVSFALAGVAGVLLAMRTTFTPFSGVERLLISFEVVVLGGLGSFWAPCSAESRSALRNSLVCGSIPIQASFTPISCSSRFSRSGRTAFSGRGGDAGLASHSDSGPLPIGGRRRPLAFRRRRHGSLV